VAAEPIIEGESPFVARAARDCDFDIVALGEVMLRLDPGEERIALLGRSRSGKEG